MFWLGTVNPTGGNISSRLNTEEGEAERNRGTAQHPRRALDEEEPWMKMVELGTSRSRTTSALGMDPLRPRSPGDENAWLLLRPSASCVPADENEDGVAVDEEESARGGGWSCHGGGEWRLCGDWGGAAGHAIGG